MSRMAEIALAIDEMMAKDYTVDEIAEELNLPFSLVSDYYLQVRYQELQGLVEQRLAMSQGWVKAT